MRKVILGQLATQVQRETQDLLALQVHKVSLEQLVRKESQVRLVPQAILVHKVCKVRLATLVQLVRLVHKAFKVRLVLRDQQDRQDLRDLMEQLEQRATLDLLATRVLLATLDLKA